MKPKQKPKPGPQATLSVRQPHCDLLIYSGRFCENRTWKTNFRGRLYLHASRFDDAAMASYEANGIHPARDSPGGCQVGAIIGHVELFDVVAIETLESIQAGVIPPGCEQLAEKLAGSPAYLWDFAVGPWCWLMFGGTPLRRPVPAKGRLGLWKCNIPG